MQVILRATKQASILAFAARSSLCFDFTPDNIRKYVRVLIYTVLISAPLLTARAQEQSVSGTVTSAENGDPIPGVNVVVKGTSIGTTTNVDGAFMLEVPANAVISFSFIGFASQEINVNGRTIIDVLLAPEVSQLSEVVITAAGIEREVRGMGTRLETVRGSQIQQISEADPLRGLQGKVAGVNITSSSGVPGSSTRITMRGNRSLLGNNQPLVVVDGIPFENLQTSTTNQLVGGGSYGSGFSSIDPNNIETLTLLPPGSAEASIYGVRAANGVVVITTKTGKSRASRQGLEVSVSSGFSLEEISGLPDYQNKYGTGTGFAYGQVNGSWGAPFSGTVKYPTTTTIPLWLDYAAAFPDRPKTVPYQAYPDNVKDFFRTGKLFENSITLSGGNEKSNFTTTISRTDQEGYIPASGFERTNISIGANTILTNKLVIGGTFSFSNRVQNGPPGGASNAIGNGSAFARILYLGRNWDLKGEPFEDPLTRESLFFIDRTQATNPYWATKYDGFETRENRVTGNLNFAYDFTDEFNLSYRIGLTHYNEMNQEWFRPGGRAVGGIGQIVDDYVSSMEIESFLRLNYLKPLSDD
ncbi:MAG: carboxypeptidase-like regulatory domain-containing protein, partial [Bacteroidota bacterium]|nr:carboxypeptidase-like regulatory domain-containing protein [Bacteroidota bacterium]